MINPFMIAGLVFLAIGALQEAGEDTNKGTKLLAGPAGAPGKRGPKGDDGKTIVTEKPAKKEPKKPAVSDG